MKILLGLIFAAYAFDPSNRPKCLISGQGTEGWNQINSPQYPNPLPANIECLYILSAPAGAKLELAFDDFELASKGNVNCKRQSLRYLDPQVTSVPGVTKTFCGNQVPKSIISKGNEVYLLLSSNMKDGGMKGFQIKYRLAEKEGSKMKGVAKGGSKTKKGKKGKQAGKVKETVSTVGEIRVALENDVPIALKSKSLGGKTDQNYKALLKWMFIGIGACAGGIIVFLLYRRFTGAKEGLPEPTVTLPEGTLPTHLKAIDDFKAKLKSEGKEYVPDSD